MLRFRQMRSLQKFASVHANVHNHFNLERHLVDRKPTSSSAQPPWPSGRSTRARLPSSKTGVHRRETSSHWTDSTGARPSRRPSLAQRLARDDRARRTGSAQSAPSPDRGTRSNSIPRKFSRSRSCSTSWLQTPTGTELCPLQKAGCRSHGGAIRPHASCASPGPRLGASSYAGQVTRLWPDDDRGHHQKAIARPDRLCLVRRRLDRRACDSLHSPRLKASFALGRCPQGRTAGGRLWRAPADNQQDNPILAIHAPFSLPNTCRSLM
jgi:hypothetical protein